MVRRLIGTGTLMAALGSVLGCGDPSIGPDWHYIGRGGATTPTDMWIDETSIRQSGPYLEVRERARFVGGATENLVRALEVRALYDCAERRIAVKSVSFFSHRDWATTPIGTVVEDGQERWSPAGDANTTSAMKLDYVCGKLGR